jgi:hypothetical protein
MFRGILHRGHEGADGDFPEEQLQEAEPLQKTSVRGLG